MQNYVSRNAEYAFKELIIAALKNLFTYVKELKEKKKLTSITHVNFRTDNYLDERRLLYHK